MPLFQPPAGWDGVAPAKPDQGKTELRGQAISERPNRYECDFLQTKSMTLAERLRLEGEGEGKLEGVSQGLSQG